jgi:cytochrome d ubiquinol oxidase subunit II
LQAGGLSLVLQHIGTVCQRLVLGGAMVALTWLFGLEVFSHFVLSHPAFAPRRTIYNAASSTKTLGIMLTIAMVGVPIALAYTVSIYWNLRGKVKLERRSY